MGGVRFVAKASTPRAEGTTVKGVLRYREAMYVGYRRLSDRPVINTTLCARVAKEIKGGDPTIEESLFGDSEGLLAERAGEQRRYTLDEAQWREEEGSTDF